MVVFFVDPYRQMAMKHAFATQWLTILAPVPATSDKLKCLGVRVFRCWSGLGYLIGE